MALLIKNGDVVTADARYRADVWCEGETVTAVGANLPAPAGAEVTATPRNEHSPMLSGSPKA